MSTTTAAIHRRRVLQGQILPSTVCRAIAPLVRLRLRENSAHVLRMGFDFKWILFTSTVEDGWQCSFIDPSCMLVSLLTVDPVHLCSASMREFCCARTASYMLEGGGRILSRRTAEGTECGARELCDWLVLEGLSHR
jgi:hypothetical protein